MAISADFSVVIPTYTGQDVISNCFDSILMQVSKEYSFETIVVIDGPNKSLEKIVGDYKQRFAKKGLIFEIIRFDRNQGRFMARMEGAKAAHAEYLIFIDDRVKLSENYFKTLKESHKDVVVPNVIEDSYPNFVSHALGQIRKKLYKNMTGVFRSFEIDEANFDSTPKGTTSLWVNRKLFIGACNQIVDKYAVTKNISDDTLLLRSLLNETQLYKSSEARIFYQPRGSAIDELRHIFQRGPKFVNYYFFEHPSKYLAFFLVIIVAAVLFTFQLLIYPQLAPLATIVVMASSVMTVLYLGGLNRNFAKIWLGLALIMASFGLGIIYGLITKPLSNLIQHKGIT